MRNPTNQICRRLCDGMTFVSIVLMALLPIPITYDVIMRATGNPTIWVFQVTLYAFIAAGFLANPAAMLSRTHFRVTALHTLFPKLALPLDIFAILATMLFALILTGAGAYFVHYSWTNGIVSASLFEVPMWLPQLAVPVGGIGLFLSNVIMLLRVSESDETGEAPMNALRE